MGLNIGITGGIGSGKTTVCKIFATLEIPIYYADERAKALMTENEALKEQLVQIFGQETYLPSGAINRNYLANIVFNDKKALDQLNAIVHPAVKKDGLEWAERHSNAIYTLREAALIYESGIDKTLDYVIVVTAPESLRIQRVMERDNVKESAVKARMDKQWPEAEKVKKADFLIHNDGQQSLVKQVLSIHKQIISYSDNKEIPSSIGQV